MNISPKWATSRREWMKELELTRARLEDNARARRNLRSHEARCLRAIAEAELKMKLRPMPDPED